MGHAWSYPRFDRYSNTLLLSFNNRIYLRDSYEARGKVFDCQVVTVPVSVRLEAIEDTIILEAEKTQEDLMRQPVAEA